MATSPRSLLQQVKRIAAERQRSQGRVFTAMEQDTRADQLFAAAAASGAPVHPRILEIINLARARRAAATFADLA